jgi:hypothetical protein
MSKKKYTNISINTIWCSGGGLYGNIRTLLCVINRFFRRYLMFCLACASYSRLMWTKMKLKFPRQLLRNFTKIPFGRTDLTFTPYFHSMCWVISTHKMSKLLIHLSLILLIPMGQNPLDGSRAAHLMFTGNSSPCKEHKGPLPCSQEPATGSYPGHGVTSYFLRDAF